MANDRLEQADVEALVRLPDVARLTRLLGRPSEHDVRLAVLAIAQSQALVIARLEGEKQAYRQQAIALRFNEGECGKLQDRGGYRDSVEAAVDADFARRMQNADKLRAALEDKP